MNFVTWLLKADPDRKTRFHTLRGDVCLNPVDICLSLTSTIRRRFAHRFPRAPWFCLPAVRYLRRSLHGARVFEFSSGMSTVWFADRCREVVSVEHDPIWFERVSALVSNRSHVRTILARSDAEYLAAVEEYPPDYFDLISVDGRVRRDCVAAALRHLRPGGQLLLDNSDAPEYQAAERLLRASFPPSAVRVFRGFPLGSFHPTETLIARSPERAGTSSMQGRAITVPRSDP